MSEFVDPRLDPSPRSDACAARLAGDPEELSELVGFCRNGQLYEVERWIRGAHPLQLGPEKTSRGRRRSTVLEIALERGDHSLVHLLLCNGYDVALEPRSPLDRVLRDRRMDLLDLLLDWGADPHDADLDDLFSTYSTSLFERFLRLGVDLTAEHAIAEHLSEHTSNKPLFGFCKRHRTQDPKVQTELDIALAHHARRGHEKGVQLCLWAGANPHAPVPNLRWTSGRDDDEDVLRHSAVHEASSGGFAGILETLRPDPTKDDYDELYRWAGNRSVVDILARSALPSDVDGVIQHRMWWASIGTDSDWQAMDVMERLFALGMRWERSAPERLGSFRRELLRLSDDRFVAWVKLLAKEEYCSDEVLAELGRTPSIRKRMKKVGFIPGGEGPRGREVYRPTGSRRVLKRFSIELPKPKREQRLHRTVWIGPRRATGRKLRLTREELFERVWSEPVSRIATEWGLSGPGLAKACRRLKIPLPPRGYWARVRAGRSPRRPRLPGLREGEAEEILVWMPVVQ